MRAFIFALGFIPFVSAAQFDTTVPVFNAPTFNNVQPQPVYGIPVQPMLPVPRDRGPWNTGYSVVTTTRTKRPSILGSDYDRDLTGEETVTRIVPNDALGNPIRGVDLW